VADLINVVISPVAVWCLVEFICQSAVADDPKHEDSSFIGKYFTNKTSKTSKYEVIA
jgi:hypothetical protein